MTPIAIDPDAGRVRPRPIEECARAIYAALPNRGRRWVPNTRGGSSEVWIDDVWEDAPDRHEDCRRQAAAAFNRLIKIGFITPGGIDALREEQGTGK